MLDQTLATAEPTGSTVGTLTRPGSTSSPNMARDCLKAVRLLNKSTVDAGKKMSSDPAFNLAAQLLAADLNVVAGAGSDRRLRVVRTQNAFAADFHSRRRCAMSSALSSSLPLSSTWRSEGSARK